MAQWLRLCLPGHGVLVQSLVKIPHTSLAKKQNLQQKQCGNKFNKDFKNGPHQKKKKLKKKDID